MKQNWERIYPKTYSPHSHNFWKLYHFMMYSPFFQHSTGLCHLSKAEDYIKSQTETLSQDLILGNIIRSVGCRVTELHFYINLVQIKNCPVKSASLEKSGLSDSFCFLLLNICSISTTCCSSPQLDHKDFSFLQIINLILSTIQLQQPRPGVW